MKRALYEIWVEVPEGMDAKLLGADLAGTLSEHFNYYHPDDGLVSHKWRLQGPIDTRESEK